MPGSGFRLPAFPFCKPGETMHFRSLFLPVLTLFWILAAAPEAGPGLPDEGMWPFHDLPRETLKEKYGFEPDQEWLDHLRMASLKVSEGGSASFVSSEGLVMTNHHVALGLINALSSEEQDLVEGGFLARTREEELPCPDAELEQLVSMKEVTEEIRAATEGIEDDTRAMQARRAVIGRMEARESEATGLRCKVVSLHGGAQYYLYCSKVYEDVRLVFAPEKQVAYFGGDRDNFTYPRYCLDVSFLRAYEDGKPARIENHLEWCPDGVGEGDLIFISGNPASTGRYHTLGRLRFERDVYMPGVLQLIQDREAALSDYAEGNEDRRMEVLDELFSLRNSIKAYTGMLKALEDPEIWGELERREKAFREKMKDNEEVIAAFETIEEVRKRYGEIFGELAFMRLDGELGQRASAAVGMAMAADRMGEEQLRQRLETITSGEINEDLASARLAAGLSTARAMLGEDHPYVKTALQGRGPGKAAEEIVEATILKDPEAVGKLVHGGPDALKASQDTLVQMALLRHPKLAEKRREAQKLMARESAAEPVIARARFRLHGDEVYPDATFTLRLSFGEVKGYELGTTDVPWKTNFWGLYARNSSMDGAFPYNLPERWEGAAGKLDLDTPLNFVSTADTTGGNSGSPAVDRDGHVVGVLFDGNIQSLLVDNLYDETVARSICVDTRGIAHALDRIYNAKHLLEELGLRDGG